jgi:hypothetical protein
MKKECLDDCWLCYKKADCKLENNCAVFTGVDCGMKDVCAPQRAKCPLRGGFQLELSFVEVG